VTTIKFVCKTQQNNQLTHVQIVRVVTRALATCPGLDAHLVLVTREVCGSTVRHLAITVLQALAI
jgi:hypothetical protein